jgi:flagellar basal-body rod protein FlgC
MDISASGLRAQRIRMETISNNLANLETTSTEYTQIETDENGQQYVRHIPYRRKVALFSAGLEDQADGRLGVTVPAVVEDISTAFEKRFDPQHAHAVKTPGPDQGYVYFPNVNPLVETVDMIAASRAYEANIMAMDALKSMGEASLRILA